MRKSYFAVALFVLLVLPFSITAASEDRQEASQLTDRQEVQAPVSRAACTMIKTSGNAASYWPSYAAGHGTYTYYDPAVECGPAPYPFQLTAFSLTLYDPDGTYVWPAMFDVVVRSVTADGNPCNGPQGELCRFSASADQAIFEFPNLGTLIFPSGCCITEPVFIGIEYTSGGFGSIPSVLYDDNPAADTCDNWILDPAGAWTEWYNFWNPPVAGYPMFWVDGETQSPNCATTCDWNPGDPFKMHYPQLPNAEGWAVNATSPLILADDWMCSETGWIKDFHWWGGWMHGIEGQVVSFILSIHTDIPASQNPDGYSKPGALLFEMEVPIDQINVNGIDPPSLEGWFDPLTGEFFYDDHQPYFQYNFCLPEQMWFWQEVGTIYWVNISAIVADPQNTQWGWKSTLDHWNDDAVWMGPTAPAWFELFEPGTGGFPYTPGDVDGDGDVDQDDVNMLVGWLVGGGPAPTSWTPDGVFYPAADVNGDCTVDINDMAILVDYLANGAPPLVYCPQYPPGTGEAISLDLAFVVTGEPPAEDGACCLPNGSCVQLTENECLGQAGTWMGPGTSCAPDEACCFSDGSCLMADPNCCNSMGGNPQGPGTSCSAPEACCLPDGNCVMADPICCFAMGGEPQGPGSDCGEPEACCLSDGSCIMAYTICCVSMGGTPQGPGSFCTGDEACCLPDGSCMMVDPLCCTDMGGMVMGPGTVCLGIEACCLQDGSCVMVDALCCLDMGGSPHGPGSTCSAPEACCLADNSCIMADPQCCADMGGTPQGAGSDCANNPCVDPTGACCMPDNSCVDGLTEAECTDASNNGTYMGDGSYCFGDNNGNGQDDLCEDPWQPGDGHKMHYPQLPDEAGWDVSAMFPEALADDWMCGGTGWVSDLHFWGSWKHGLEGTIGLFVITIYADIPADQSGTGYSMPGPMLWETTASQFSATRLNPPTLEGWYDPNTGEVLPDNHQEYFQYDVYFNTNADAFWQEEGTIYWMGIQAVVENDQEYRWGWKSSVNHWNDDAVYGLPDWMEMYEPGTGGSGFPYTPGDVNGDGDVDADDVNAMEDWFFGGIPPTSWTPGGSYWPAFDVDGDCLMTVNDMAVLNIFLANGSPPLVFCEQYPPGEPAVSMDLSFVITGDEVCDCTPGDANNDGLVNVGDAVYIINFVFLGGPPPSPYPICSGDANCDCLTNVGDAVYIINYVFNGGSAPCDCDGWLLNCGPPLRK